jgi:hypothetical protein
MGKKVGRKAIKKQVSFKGWPQMALSLKQPKSKTNNIV